MIVGSMNDVQVSWPINSAGLPLEWIVVLEADFFVASAQDDAETWPWVVMKCSIPVTSGDFVQLDTEWPPFAVIFALSARDEIVAAHVKLSVVAIIVINLVFGPVLEEFGAFQPCK